jgi:hypothetical protein
MRVWILETTPDYEQGTRHGVYASALAAWDDLFTLADAQVFPLWKFDMYVGGDEEEQGDARAILVRLTYNSNDQITLRGEYVKGSAAGGGVAPTLGDWRDLQQVAGLLRQHAVQVVGFRLEGENPNHLATGSWSLAKPDLPF